MANSAPIHVAKLGGSLLTMDDLPMQFARWRDAGFHGRRVLVIGGGRPADAVRDVDDRFGLDESAAHWLAIRAMQLNAHLFATVLADVQLVESVAACENVWARSRVALIDPLPWLLDEQARGIAIPHRWSFTSDSVAAHVAAQLGAATLTMLKSVLPAQVTTRAQAAAVNLVDADFPIASARVPQVELLNLRDASHARVVLTA